LLVLVGVSTGCERKPAPFKPLEEQLEIEHIVLISVDTLRADYLGCYGHPFVQSPNIDALAQEGVRFTRHINAAPTTLASHTAMMTGTHPHTHGAPKNGFILDERNEMLAEVLKAAGFTTAAFIGAFPLDSAFKFDQGFDHFDDAYEMAEEKGVRDQAQRRAEAVTDSVIAWLDERGQTGGRLFLFVHYFDVHWPYEAPAPYGRMYRSDDYPFGGSMRAIRTARKLLRAQDPRGETLTTILAAEYAAEVTYCDVHVGRLFDALKARGLYDKSLIVLTSDHGETMDEHENFFNHGQSVYDTEVLTPLIIRFPGGEFAGRTEARLVSNIDVMPSLLHWLGLPPTQRMEGVSFAGLIDGPLPERAPVFAEATQPWGGPFDDDRKWRNNPKYQCVRTETHKYLSRTADQRQELYDLVEDGGEQRNLLGDAGAPDADLLKRLREALQRWRNGADPLPSMEAADAAAKLAGLGYVDRRDEEEEEESGEDLLELDVPKPEGEAP
jgi:arylsulfatase